MSLDNTTSDGRAARPGLAAGVAIAGVVTIALWASAFPGIRAAMKSYSPESVALLRYLVASLVLGLYAFWSKMPWVRWRDVPILALTGLIGIAFYNVALNTGEETIQSGVASLIVASAPIFVALFAVLFLRERLRLWGWIGILLSFLGVGLFSFNPQTNFALSPSALLVLAAAVSQAIYSVIQKPFLGRYRPLQCTSLAIWAGTLALLVFSPGLAQQVRSASLESTLAVVYLGVFPAAIGYVAWGFVLSRLPASRAGSLLYFIPALAFVIAWFWLGETMTLTAVVGGLFVLSGVVVVNTIGRAGRSAARSDAAEAAAPIAPGESPAE